MSKVINVYCSHYFDEYLDVYFVEVSFDFEDGSTSTDEFCATFHDVADLKEYYNHMEFAENCSFEDCSFF